MRDAPRLIGTRVPRLEDPRLLRGQGHYVDDIDVPGALHAVFVRSPHAHALIRGIDFSAARALPGVVACCAAADLAPPLTGLRMPLAFPEGQIADEPMWFVLAPEEVAYVGEAVAMVVADSRYVAEDAAALVEVDYEPLPAVVDARAALDPATPLSRRECRSNIVTRYRASYGDVDGAFARAHRRLHIDYFQHRGAGHPMEPRGVLASPDRATGVLTVWSSTQKAYAAWADLCRMLALDEHLVRVIVPDVGGGFGTKYAVYPEEIAVPAAAVKLGRPVKWIDDRAEHFVSAIQERDQFLGLDAAVDADGRLLAVRGRLVHDQGAYSPHNIAVPYNSGTTFAGPYVLPAFDMDIVVAQTNKPPVIPVRGAGYPQACFVMERLMDTIAAELGLDRADVRSRNYIPPEQFPYALPLKNRAGVGVVYDSGDYPACQKKALAAAGYAGFRERQAQARAQGRCVGIGIAAAVKGTGRGPYESGAVRVTPNGKVNVLTGAHEMGQGIRTSLAQVCAATLGVRMEDVHVIAADTHHMGLGHGGYASRQAVAAGSAVSIAAQAVRAKALRLAAKKLEVAESDLDIVDGRVQVRGVPGMGMTLASIATTLRGMPGYGFPAGLDAGLEATHHFHSESLMYANAFHVCEVEVDPGTGGVRILRYVALQDSGRLVNPLIVEGQIHGSIAHGIGNALFEHMRYDENGQPLTATFADYLLPTAPEVPNVEILFHETPSPLNPLGLKGVGETGLIPVTSAVIGAIEDALAPYGVRIYETPVSPMRLVELIREARQVKARWDLVLLPALIVSALLLVVSQAVFLHGSFRRDLGMGQQGDELELTNYLQAFADPYYLEILRLSVEASAMTTVFTVLIAFPVAYIIARMRSRWALFLLAAVVVSSFVTIVVKVLGLILIFSANGPFNQLLLWLGLVTEPVTIIGTLTGAVVGLMYYSLGYAVLLFYSVVVTVPRSVEEAAEIHGATRFGVLRQVVLPLCLPGLVAGVLTIFNVSMGGFSSTALIGAGKVLTVPVVIQRTMLLENNVGMAAALAALLLLSVIVINVLSVAAVARARRGMVV